MMSYSMLPASVRRLGEECLGEGVLQSYVHPNSELIMNVKDDILVGFSLYHIEGEVGYLDVVCVGTVFRGEGFGRELIVSSLRKMAARHIVRVISTVRSLSDITLEPGIPCLFVSEFLHKIGFRLIHSYPAYFERESIAYNYRCVLCGSFPCECNGDVYTLSSF